MLKLKQQPTTCSQYDNCILTNNRSGSSEYGFGGAIHVHSSNLTLAENTFQHNFAYKGGALEVFTNTTGTLSRNIFHNNSANCGGGFYAHANNTLTLSENTFQDNSADKNGGALIMNIGNSVTHNEQISQVTTLLFILEVLFWHKRTMSSPF